PPRFTKFTMSVSDTVRPSVRYVAPIACASKFSPSPIMSSSTRRSRLGLFSQIRAADVDVAGQLGGGPGERDRAGLEHVAAAGDAEGHGVVLLDEQDRGAPPVDVHDRLEDLLDYDRGQAHARLVEQEQAGTRHQRAADRQHLLL